MEASTRAVQPKGRRSRCPPTATATMVTKLPVGCLTLKQRSNLTCQSTSAIPQELPKVRRVATAISPKALCPVRTGHRLHAFANALCLPRLVVAEHGSCRISGNAVPTLRRMCNDVPIALIVRPLRLLTPVLASRATVGFRVQLTLGWSELWGRIRTKEFKLFTQCFSVSTAAYVANVSPVPRRFLVL